ncbi:MAG: ImmA/IrrE family metallo-endopeptidase [Clostridia bacterium]|nr:ImmA/IrrE family metallo-endopeptidase [Clostridia bacterium]
MPIAPRIELATRFACAVIHDDQIGRLPVNPFDVAAIAGISLLPLSQAMQDPGWIPWNLPALMGMTDAVTIAYPVFCIIYRDDVRDPGRLRWVMAHELGHLFMNHFRDFPDQMGPGLRADSGLEAEADMFARNLLAPVPLVDVIRYNRPQQAKAPLFGLSRSAWMRRLDSLAEDRSFITAEMADTVLFSFRSWLLGRRCPSCGLCFEDTADTGCCPSCGCTELEWLLEENPA